MTEAGSKLVAVSLVGFSSIGVTAMRPGLSVQSQLHNHKSRSQPVIPDLIVFALLWVLYVVRSMCSLERWCI